ncbi:MAG: hypothetical protein QME69_09870 [Candidatus Saccharicenans sp.]|nr:hypothetical protein [Candidatus Saccharicenans sp.]
MRKNELSLGRKPIELLPEVAVKKARKLERLKVICFMTDLGLMKEEARAAV